MAHLIVNAAATSMSNGTVLVVAVSGSEDGLPRTGLSVDHFAVYQLQDIRQGVPAPRAIERVGEGPDGCYSLILAPATGAGSERIGRELFSLAVNAPTQGGWADEHGLCIAASA